MFKIKKGFTLIEVIVSIALLGALAAVFLPSMTYHFKGLVDTKVNITQKAFSEQDSMEMNIKMLEKALSKGQIDSDDYDLLGISDKIDIKLFEDEFSRFTSRLYPSAYQIEIPAKGNKKFITLVGDKRVLELPVPEIEAESLIFLKEDTESLGSHEYSTYPGLKLKAISNMKTNPENSFNRYRSDWFVSKPGFNIPIQDIGNIDEDNDFSRIYPSFPDDYIALPIHSELGSAYSYVSMTERKISAILQNNIVSKYPGRHILYTITPFAKSLKKGVTSSVLPVYIYGPNVTENLAFHLDASTINMSDIYHSTNNTVGTLVVQDENYYIRSWKNSRPSLKSPATNLNAVQTDINKMPILMRNNDSNETYTGLAIPFQDGETSERVWSRALGNKQNTMSSMRISNIQLSNSWSIFMIMRRVDSPLSPIIDTSIIKGTGSNPWSIDWTGDSGAPCLALIEQNNRAELSSTLNLGEWYLVHATASSSNIYLEINSLKNGSNYTLNATGPTSNISTNSIDLQWNGVEISEILIYNSNMNSSNLDSIKTYLINKYNPH